MRRFLHERLSHRQSTVLTPGLILASLLTAAPMQAAEGWVDVSGSLLARLTNSGARLDWPGGCSGIVVNRTNGDVTLKVVGQGLWRRSASEAVWARVDGGTVSGRDETGWATSADPEAPGRMASFSLDGSAGGSADGREWKAFANLGRNWDYGSVDWSAAQPKTVIAARHETTPPGEVYLSGDGGQSWRRLDIHLQDGTKRVSMVGALSDGVLIYSRGDGIQRSTNAGVSWHTVASDNPQTRIPVRFRGAYYLGGTNGLIVTRDNGATWSLQGKPADIWQGPFFGRDENDMVIVGGGGAQHTTDGGRTWRRVADLKGKESGFLFTVNWFGCYAWDPVHGFLYASSMGNPVYRLKLKED